jgi:YesN/AraC family two-component response regulator
LNPTILNYIPGIKDGAIFKRVTKKNYFSIIEKVIEKQKLYLRPRLTVNDITLAIGVSEKDISAAILLKTKYNFNDYINKYRIDTAIKLIHQKFLDSHTTVSRGEKCGFNSHQSFFRAFKKNKNTTPKEYDSRHNKYDSRHNKKVKD